MQFRVGTGPLLLMPHMDVNMAELMVSFVCLRRQKAAELAGSDEEDVDELSLIDHKEIMSRITLKQEVS